MKITMVLEETSRTGLITLDGPLNGETAMEFLPLIDGVMIQMCLQGWTFLLGSRHSPPTVMDPSTVIAKLAERTRTMQDPGPSPEASPMHQPVPVPNPPPPPVDPNQSPEDRRTAMFRSWTGDTTPPDPKPPEEPPKGPDEGPETPPDSGPTEPKNPPPEPA